MASNMVSTHEVAAMLNVTETTIKRWADENLLPCVRTPGGHRKFLLRDIVRFAESRGYAIGGARPPAMTEKQLENLTVGVHTGNHGLIAEIFREEALQADRDGMLSLLLYLYKHRIPFPTIVDDVIRPAFEAIGILWEKGKLEVNQEHAASHAALETLIRISAELHRKDSNGRTALCACPDGELHEIGIRALAYSLECEGWKVHYTGANTPAETLATFIRASRPSLVCISVTTTRNGAELLARLKRLAAQVHAYRGAVIVGGHYAHHLSEKDGGCDRVSHSIQDAVEYARHAFGLKPGPKNKHSATVKTLH